MVNHKITFRVGYLASSKTNSLSKSRLFIFLILLLVIFINGCTTKVYINKTSDYNIRFFNNKLEIELQKGCNYAPFEGTSMIPTLKTGDTAILCPIIEEIEINDIVCINISKYCERKKCEVGEYERSCHRVIDIKEDKGITYYITRGDNIIWFIKEKVLREELDYMIIGVFY